MATLRAVVHRRVEQREAFIEALLPAAVVTLLYQIGGALLATVVFRTLWIVSTNALRAFRDGLRDQAEFAVAVGKHLKGAPASDIETVLEGMVKLGANHAKLKGQRTGGFVTRIVTEMLGYFSFRGGIVKDAAGIAGAVLFATALTRFIPFIKGIKTDNIKQQLDAIAKKTKPLVDVAEVMQQAAEVGKFLKRHEEQFVDDPVAGGQRVDRIQERLDRARNPSPTPASQPIPVPPPAPATPRARRPLPDPKPLQPNRRMVREQDQPFVQQLRRKTLDEKPGPAPSAAPPPLPKTEPLPGVSPEQQAQQDLDLQELWDSLPADFKRNPAKLKSKV